MDTLREEINKKDCIDDKLHNEVQCLKNKVHNLETHLDHVEQYEHRDTIMLSGPSLTPEKRVSVVISAIKENRRLNIKVEDISVAYRLRSTQPGVIDPS